MNPTTSDGSQNRLGRSVLAIATGIVLLGAMPLLLVTNGGQPAFAQQGNQTTAGNATTTASAAPIDTFMARGFIIGILPESGGGQQNTITAGGANTSSSASGSNMTGTASAQPERYVVAGKWRTNVQGGNVTDFAAGFVMVKPDGSGYHTHNFTKFFSGNSTAQLVKDQPMTIKGTMDVMTNGTMAWAGVDTTVTLTGKKTVFTMELAPEDTGNHFPGPLYGIVTAATDGQGRPLLNTGATGMQAGGGNQTQQEGGGNMTGGFLGELREGIRNLTGGQ
jgi:hypothetical protein